MTAAGFTGTRDGMTPAQEAAFATWLTKVSPDVLHHGGCRGADMQAADIATSHGIYLVCHPGPGSARWGDEVRERLPYLERNRNIVNACDVLVATPRTAQEELRSGTWATVRYARQQGKPVVVIRPDGSAETAGEQC